MQECQFLIRQHTWELWQAVAVRIKHNVANWYRHTYMLEVFENHPENLSRFYWRIKWVEGDLININLVIVRC